MASRRSDKDRRRAERLAAADAAAARAKRRRWAIVLGALAAVGVIAAIVAIAAGGSGSETSTAAPAPKLTAGQGHGLPRQIGAELRHANQVIDTPLQSELAKLRGVPVVVNQWASWCPNCKFEFPFLQRESKRFRKQVAFLGLDSQDSQGNAEAFLRQYPVTYPSVFDQDASQAASIGAGRSWPTTVFFDPNGQVVNVHIGAYPTAALLRTDIQRYALRGG
jgi:cytochrome c biogenesis protein CcmG, thiol:disulfide interchange protein DsbE